MRQTSQGDLDKLHFGPRQLPEQMPTYQVNFEMSLLTSPNLISGAGMICSIR